MKKIGVFFKKFIKGFTLVELIAVLALMAIGASIVIPNLRGVMTRAERKRYETYMMNAKTYVKNFVDLLNMQEYKYPITQKDGVTVENYDISSSIKLNQVLNLMNMDTSFEYYVYDKKGTVNGKTVYYVDDTSNPTSKALKYTDTATFKGNKDIMVVCINRSLTTGVYDLRYLFYVNRSDATCFLSYIIADDTIEKGFTRERRS